MPYTSCIVLSASLAHADGGPSYEKMNEQKVKSMDGNADERLLRTNLLPSKKINFKDMNSNGDGQVSLDEVKAGYKKMDGGHKGK
jgi:hypothetical protein